MKLHRTTAVVILGLAVGLLADASAQEDNEPSLEDRVKALETENRKLNEEVGGLRDEVQGFKKNPPSSPNGDDDGEVSLAELQEHIRDLEDRLDLLPTFAGYYDFEYIDDDKRNSPRSFRQHHVSRHLSKELQSFRLFSEIEFEYGTKFEGDGKKLDESRGEVKVEQAWVDYTYSDLVVLRAGLILTPGYWNVNHYPNVVLSTRRPRIVRKIFRESFTCLMLYGSKWVQDAGMSYEVYVGNGDGPFFTKSDDDEGKAVGGRLTAHIPTGDTFDRFDIAGRGYVEDKSGDQPTKVWGVEAQINKGPFETLFEFALRDGVKHKAGLYVQPSYRFLERWAAFYRYDLLRIENAGSAQEHTLGLNFRPIPYVSLKVEVFHSHNSKSADFNGIASSVAVAF